MKTQKAEIGILCWEAGQVPRGLVQLESLVGNSTNPDSYAFPVRFCRVKGANIHTILENPSREVLQTMIAEAKAMVEDGVRAITTSCGFNAIFQEELAEAVDVPVFTSSLLQVPFAQKIVGRKSEVAILTAKAAALKPEHLAAAGISRTDNLHIHGLEGCPQWSKIFTSPDEDMDLEAVRKEIVGVALDALRARPRTGAFVLECTDLPPFAEEIRNETGLPVFDFITLVNYAYASL
ncbi:MAG TPA: aspartate/glutamate racemase family protein [Synergistales bacterium]|nr:aspartate/glutamate racemase family protein [Synergistales bacterium]